MTNQDDKKKDGCFKKEGVATGNLSVSYPSQSAILTSCPEKAEMDRVRRSNNVLAPWG